MKLRIKTASGEAIIGMQTSPASGGGAMPNGGSLLQILGGWPHGSTAGLGGADWNAGCGVYRGETYQLGPSFRQEQKDGRACDAAGIGRLCSPTNPSGVWIIPWRVRIPALTVPLSNRAVFRLNSPIAARLFALEACIRKGPLLPETEDPCPCDDGGCGCCSFCSSVDIRDWETELIRQTYPGLGRGTNVTIGTAAPVLYDDEEAVMSMCHMTGERLLNGQNVLPPWVPNVELVNGNDDLSWTIVNNWPLGAVDVDLLLHIRYGSFDLDAAVNDYCEAKKCGC